MALLENGLECGENADLHPVSIGFLRVDGATPFAYKIWRFRASVPPRDSNPNSHVPRPVNLAA